jgi:hypothetical protein
MAVMELCAAGCASHGARPGKYSQAQLNAIETREVEASFNECYSAASNALFDAGYTIGMSDREGGLLTGTKRDSKQSERLWISSFIEDTAFVVSMQVREVEPSLCTVRVKTSVNGEPVVNIKAIDEMWVLMQRQVLMKEPAAAAAGGSSPTPTGSTP